MTTIPKNKIVKERTAYDDLLDRSPLTKSILRNTRSAERKQLFKPKRQKTGRRISSIKVHLRDRKGAEQFALLMKRRRFGSKRIITFAGSYNDRTKKVDVTPKVH